MKEKLEQLQSATLQTIENTQVLMDLEGIKTQVLGKKGALTDILKGVAGLSNEDKPVIGKLANDVKQTLLQALESKRSQLEVSALNASLDQDTTDVTLPAIGVEFGSQHPLSQTIRDILDIFNRLGYSVKEGPEIEDEHHNFEALNIKADHPARDMHDTFYLNTGHLLRTHTSPVQIRTMEAQQPPIKIVVPGKVYRCDSDVTHSPMFHQIEGLYVDKSVSFSQLKGTLEFLLREIFGAKQKVRFRPSYFPFTEPSTEVDVECFVCKGNGCSMCKQTGWLEILGAGMVHPNVFRSVGYDPDTVSGFAFGLGIERIAMLRYKISDIRLFYEGDMRFLEQFK